MNNKGYVLPTFFTALNLFCGFIAIILVFSEEFVPAGWLIIVAAIFDGIDGTFARKTNLTSRFGLEADSLADLVSFGVASSMLLYGVHFRDWGVLGIIISFAPLACAAFRLARFNVEFETKKSRRGYTGVPAPMAAISNVSLVFLIEAGKISAMRLIYLPLLIMVCVLMVSRIGYDTFPVFSLKYSKLNTAKLIHFFICLVAVIVAWQYMFFPVMITYLLHGPLQEIFYNLRKLRSA